LKVAENPCLHSSWNVVEGESGEHEIEGPNGKLVEIVAWHEVVITRRTPWRAWRLRWDQARHAPEDSFHVSRGPGHFNL
jgi:hypothetical protein